MRSVRTILKEHRIEPRKGYGQSFLEDRDVMAGIVARAALGDGDCVVEIGAGLGVMTAMMAQRAGRVVALELDPRLVGVLEKELRACENVTIVAGDVLKYDFAEACPGQKIKVVGNIPYNISTPIIFRLLSFRAAIGEMVLMMQKEVAARLAARPGTKEYGIPTVTVGMYARVAPLMEVGPKCFFPPPKVHSSVVRITTRPQPLVPLADEGLFERLVKASFAQRRKTLYNNLKGTLFRDGEEALAEVLAAAGIDGGRRGETLTPEEFGRLSNVVASRISKPAIPQGGEDETRR